MPQGQLYLDKSGLLFVITKKKKFAQTKLDFINKSYPDLQQIKI
jgi:hypothetical protein